MEVRKSCDTRAGAWLLAVIVLVAVAVVAIQVAVTDPQGQTLQAFLLSTQLPVVGILLITSEWSQRSACRPSPWSPSGSGW